MHDENIDIEAIVLGAGFGGLRMLMELQRLGIGAQAFEAGTGVGGTWYWNRYPGARTDSESWIYCMRNDEDLLQEWNWTERFPGQPEVERYLNHVAERHDLLKDIEFSTRVTTATYDEDANTWTVQTDTGRTLTCRLLISATGLISVPLAPAFEGIDDFQGDWYLTARWPKERVDFRGKRVGVVGTGATAVQAIPLISQDCDSLTVFQRTPNFVMPGRNHALDDYERGGIKKEYDAIWAQCDQHFFGFPMSPSGKLISESSEEEIRRGLEQGWEVGGFRFVFETFDDMLVDEQSNEIASEFVRDKIRSIIDDPETAELLCPTNHGIAIKRPPLGHYYYETYNKSHVHLVDVSGNAIDRVTPKGIRLADGTEYEFDIIVFATGFDAGTGALMQVDVQGRGGRRLGEVWADGPQTHLGVAVTDFPNMLMISGPQTPFANIPMVIDHTVRFLGQLIEEQESRDAGTIDVTQEAMDAWTAHLDVLINATLLGRGAEVRSWFLGANVPGKPHKILFHMGGANLYVDDWHSAIADGWRGFTFGEPAAAVVGA